MNPRVIGIGEVLWDLLPDGPQLGGAPANFACHALALGARATVLTRIGQDARGNEILQRFKSLGLPCEQVQVDSGAPTGTVTVTLAQDGVPQFVIHEGVAWDRLTANEQAMETVRTADAVCFGTLAQRTDDARAAIQQLVAAAPATSLRVLDINLRQKSYSRAIIEESLRLTNVFKLNEGELATIDGMFELGHNARAQVERIARDFKQHVVALTLGPNGSLLFQEGRWSEQRPRAVAVVDTVGAGDAFTAALVIGLLKGMDLDAVHAAAAEVASYVCSRAGATPALPARFRQFFESSARG